ncbi:MAG: flagellar FliJ family protein [Alphaproteobacteria bacterium]|nr:flagellar FliJ family protein [Alphaproteobacteria bacterium]
MKNSLQTLTRIKKFDIDEQRKILVEYQTVEDKLLAALKDLNAEFEREKLFSAQNPGIGDFGAYVKRYMRQREELEAALADIRSKIAAVQEVIADMFKEQKTFEIVDDNRKKRKIKEDNDKEQKMLDEIGTNNYIKHNK